MTFPSTFPSTKRVSIELANDSWSKMNMDRMLGTRNPLSWRAIAKAFSSTDSRNPVPNSGMTSNAQPMIFSVISPNYNSDRRSSCKSCKSMFVSPVVSTGEGYASLLTYCCLFPAIVYRKALIDRTFIHARKSQREKIKKHIEPGL